MQVSKTRETVLKAFEHGLTDTARGAFIGSFSIATVQVLFTSIASEVVPVSRHDEVDERFLLAEVDVLLPDAWARSCFSFRKTTVLLIVMEWRCPGLPSLFTVAAGWHRGALLRSNPEQSLACSVAGYRLCDPTQARVWNGVMYRKAYRGWRPVRDLNKEPVCLDALLTLACALGIEVESSIGWRFSRWFQAQLERKSGCRPGRPTRYDLEIEAPQTAA